MMIFELAPISRIIVSLCLVRGDTCSVTIEEEPEEESPCDSDIKTTCDV